MKRLWLISACLLAATSCSDTPRAASVAGAGRTAATVPADLIADVMGGLRVAEEDITALEKEAGDESYLASTRLWSLREGDRLRATLQVGRLVPDAGGATEDEEEEFQLRVVAQIGQSEPRLRVLGGEDVYVTAANSQPVYIWFRERMLYVLSVDEKLPEPRALLREAMAVGR